MDHASYGGEQYLLQEPLTRIVRSHVPDASGLNKLVYDAGTTDLDTVLEDTMMIPFFLDYKIVLVHHVNFLGAADEYVVDTATLERYLNDPLESTVLVLVGDFEKLDVRKRIVKKVQKTYKVL